MHTGTQCVPKKGAARLVDSQQLALRQRDHWQRSPGAGRGRGRVGGQSHRSSLFCSGSRRSSVGRAVSVLTPPTQQCVTNTATVLTLQDNLLTFEDITPPGDVPRPASDLCVTATDIAARRGGVGASTHVDSAPPPSCRRPLG